MHYIALLASAFALASPALAAPAPDSHLIARQNGILDGYAWTVSSWNSGCTGSGCNYDFNVTGIKDGYLPGFKAYCSGYDTGFFNTCTLLEGGINEGTGPPSVSAKLRPNQQDQVAEVTVSLRFQCDSCSSPATYNMTGSYDAAYNLGAPVPTEEFRVVVDGVTGVAK